MADDRPTLMKLLPLYALRQYYSGGFDARKTLALTHVGEAGLL
jgi:hypothetical protein